LGLGGRSLQAEHGGYGSGKYQGLEHGAVPYRVGSQSVVGGALAPGLGAAQQAAGSTGQQQRGGRAGQQDQGRHGGGAAHVAGVVHVQHGDGGEDGVGAVQEDRRRYRGHRRDEQVADDVQQRR